MSSSVMRICLSLVVFAALGSNVASADEIATDTAATYAALATAGAFEVQFQPLLELHGDARDKDLQLRVTWPEGDGPYPIIVWSQGAFGSRDNYQPLVRHWVSHGYVCIQANHSDSLALGGRPGPTAFLDWENRPKDVSFILDSIDEITERIPDLRGRLDTERIGVGGHSFGAHTSQLIGGVTTRQLRREQRSHADERVAAVLLVSPQGTGTLLNENSWDGLTRPAMVITGSKDESPRTGEPYTWRLESFEYAPEGDKYLLFIEDAWHGFGGIAGAVRTRSSGPANEAHVQYVQVGGLALWNAYLKDDSAARDLLGSIAFEDASQGEARLTSK